MNYYSITAVTNNFGFVIGLGDQGQKLIKIKNKIWLKCPIDMYTQALSSHIDSVCDSPTSSFIKLATQSTLYSSCFFNGITLDL